MFSLPYYGGYYQRPCGYHSCDLAPRYPPARMGYPTVYMDPYGAMFNEMQQDAELAERLVDQIFVPLAHSLQQQLAQGDQQPRRRPIEVKDDKEKLQIDFDVSQYKPDELNVKVVERALIVEGKHEEKDDKGESQVKRQFSRRIVLPKDVESESVVSSLTKDGVLTVEAKKKALPAPEERKIEIRQAEPQPSLEQAAAK
jgi:HSP20 family molecular chaperone IbpA